MAVFDSVVDGGQCTCGARGGWKCVCDVPIYRKRVAPMERWPDVIERKQNAALKLRMEIEAKEQHRRISIREAMHETRRARSLRELHDCYKFYRRTEGDYEKMMRIRRCLARGYRTMGDVEDVRLLAAFWATCGDLEQFVGLFLPYLEVTT